MGKTELKNQIRRLRFDHDEMTQQELASRVGVTRQTIIAIEHRKYAPSLPLALTIVAAGSAAVVLFSGSASLGQLGGVLAATLSVAFSVACFKPSLTLARGAVPVRNVVGRTAVTE